MKDNIVFKKMWEDNELMQIQVFCYSNVVTTISKIYVSVSLLDELIYQINQFLNGCIEEALWANEDKGNSTTACLNLRFFKKDKQGHILIEVFAELDDGGDYNKHNCCFFINTEYGLLMDFCEKIVQLKHKSPNYEIQLNNIN